MDYTSIFTLMRAEVTLTAILVLVFLYDLVAGERGRRRFSAVVCGLLAVQTAVCLLPGGEGEAFGGMFQYHPMHGIVKGILAAGALVVCLQANTWLRREDTRHKQGEFYILTLSTLLGMYFMIGAGNFLLFFIGLELASVPAACLVAFDKYKRYSAEAGAKYILCALFSSGLMLYGISFLYGTTGTLYFDDMTARLTGSPLQVMALVFFFSGLGFKISLVPFHLWTADTYQGAPTAVTSYLSVSYTHLDVYKRQLRGTGRHAGEPRHLPLGDAPARLQPLAFRARRTARADHRARADEPGKVRLRTAFRGHQHPAAGLHRRRNPHRTQTLKQLRL